MSRLPRSGGRRVAWGLADQVASSGANFLVVVLAARSLGATDFGAFVLGVTVCMVGVVVSRGITSDVVSAMHSADEAADLVRAQRAGLTTTLGIAAVGSTVALLTAAATSGGARELALTVAVVMPGILVQDYLRIALIVQQRARGAFLNDAAWGVLQVPALVVVDVLGGGTAALLLAWGTVGTACAAAALVQTRLLPMRPAVARAWLGRHRRLWPYFLLDNGVQQAANLGTVLVVSLASDLTQVGAMRVATTVFAPIIVLGRGVATVVVPELVRRKGRPSQVRRTAGLLGCALAPLAALGALGGLVVPQELGEAVFGETWAAARPLLLLTAVGVAGGLFSVGVFVGLRVLAAGRHGLSARIVVTVLLLVACLVGALMDGARGAVLMLALVTPLQMATWWWLLHRAAAQAGPSNSDGTSAASTADASASPL